MSWREVTIMDERLRFILLANEKTYTFKALCERFNISRKTGYKWLNRTKEIGLIEGVKNKSTKPKNSTKRIDKRVGSILVDLRKKYPQWGSRKLIELLKDKKEPNINIPSERTVNRVIERNGLKNEKSPSGVEFKRFEYEQPNDLWQMDHKGDFSFGEGKRCYPLTVLDDHSRFSLCIDANDCLSGIETKKSLIRIFREYGMPKKMLMDHGGLWYNTCSEQLRWTQLSVWLIRLGIDIIYSRIRHPQTQGKIERFHRTLKYDCINKNRFRHIEDIQEEFNQFRYEYNVIRPHEAINMQKPNERYRKSLILFNEKLAPIEYEENSLLKRVSRGGYITFKGIHWFISEALIGEFVKLKEIEDYRYEIYFINTYIKRIDLKTRTWEI